MKRIIRSVAAGLFGVLLLASASAGATVVTFDDLGGPDGAPVPAVYAGIEWDPGWYQVVSAIPEFPPHSPPIRIASATGNNGFNFIGGDRIFDGAWFAGFFSVEFVLFDDGNEVHRSAPLQLLGDGSVSFLASGYAGEVDRVVVLGFANGFVMDDVTYQDDGTPPGRVPEPGAPALMLAGMLAAGALRVRRKHKP